MGHKRIFLFVVVFIISGFSGFLLSLYVHRPVPDAEIVTIETFHKPALFVAQLSGDPEAGKKIFKEFCASCHAKTPLIDVPAPRIGDQQAWLARRALGMDALLKVTISGAGAMPARGGCFECSDAQLRGTIQYILDQSR